MAASGNTSVLDLPAKKHTKMKKWVLFSISPAEKELFNSNHLLFCQTNPVCLPDSQRLNCPVTGNVFSDLQYFNILKDGEGYVM